MSNIIIPSEASEFEKQEEQLAEIVKETPAPNLMEIAEEHKLLSNQRAPDPIPEWFNKALINIGGTNRFGEPMFKAVYGQTETQFAYGQIRLKYPAANVNEEEVTGYDIYNANGTVNYVKGSRIPELLEPGSFMVPRYKRKKLEVGMPFYIIERWQSVSDYFRPVGFHESIREGWDKEVRWDIDIESGQRIDVMGEFPSRGVYLHFFTVKTPDFNYRPLGEDVLDVVAATLEAESLFASGREYSIAIREALARVVAKKQEPIKQFKEKITDAFDSAKVWGSPQVGWTKALGESK